MIEQEVRFCTTRDQVRLAYAITGEGPPLVKAANWLSHLEFDLESPIWIPWLRALSRRHRLIRYDERGCGLSDWDVEEFSFDAWVEDLETVVEAAGVERFALLGLSQGGPVAVAYAVRHPERVSRLILYGAYARGWANRGSPEQHEERQALITLTRQGWGRDNPAFRQVFTSLFAPDASVEQMQWFNELQRSSASPDNAVRFLDAFGSIDVRDLLPQVRVPTLILHARNDAAVAYEEGRRLAAGIPGSRFVTLDSRNHILLEREPAFSTFVREVHAFLAEGEALLTPSQWNRVQKLFHTVLGKPPDARREFVAEACSDDPVVHDEVVSLLEAHERGGPVASEVGPTPEIGSAVEVDPAPAEAAAPDPHEALHLALRDRYRLEDVLGRGGMGTVFLATDRKHGRPVAIKTVHPEVISAHGPERFQREIMLTAKLQHPHILPLLDSGVAGDVLYYIMPYVEGESLRERLDRDARLPPRQAVRVAVDVLEALGYAHQRGVVHRDIKPDNVLLGEDHALIADFGIAKAIADASGTTLTESGLAIGTPAYMAPEQFSGEADGRSDLYAVGAVSYEALTGRRWKVGSAPEKADWSGVPKSLRPALQRSLQVAPDARWQDAGSFRSALPEGRIRRNWRWAAVAVPLLFAASVGTFVALDRTDEPAEPVPAAILTDVESVVIEPFDLEAAEPGLEYLTHGLTEALVRTLGRAGGLEVAVRSADHPAGSEPVQGAGAELEADALVDGSLAVRDGHLTVTVRVTDPTGGGPPWLERADGDMADLPRVQRMIAESLLRRFGGQPPAFEEMPGGGTSDPTAYGHHLRGRFELERRTREGLETAVEAFEEAVARDPAYAAAYSGLADARVLLGTLGYAALDESLEEAEGLARQALGLQPSLPEANASHGFVLHVRRDWAAAAERYRAAIRLDPFYAPARHRHAALLASLGRPDEALSELDRALRLEPDGAFLACSRGTLLLFAGRPTEALTQLERAVALLPEFAPAHAWLSVAYTERGRYDRAIEAAERAIALRPDDPTLMAQLAVAQAGAGREAAARNVAREMEDRGASPAALAQVHAVLGDREKALGSIEAALATHPVSLLDAAVHPWYDSLRDEPRFGRTLAALGLPVSDRPVTGSPDPPADESSADRGATRPR